MNDLLMHQRLRILADPSRFEILKNLVKGAEMSGCSLLERKEGGCCVADVVDMTELSQPTVSHHLKALEKVGLVNRSKRGTWACYFPNPQAIQELTLWLTSQLSSAERP